MVFHIVVEDEADIVWYKNRQVAEQLIAMATEVLRSGGRLVFEHRPINASPIPTKVITDLVELERWAGDLRSRLDQA